MTIAYRNPLAYPRSVAPVKMLLRTCFRILALSVLRVHVAVTPATFDRIRAGRAIVCANHVSFLDGIIVALSSPVPLVFPVDTDFSRRSALARGGLSLLAALGFGTIIPMDARSPFGLRAVRRALAENRSVMVFPEGCISPDGTPQPEQQGVAWLAAHTDAAIVRIRIRGAERSRLFARAGRAWWPPITVEY